MEDTIAAISTPAYGSGGIAIIRISGERAVETADRIFRAASGKKLADTDTHTINYGHIVDKATGGELDEVLVSLMRAPGTFTAEDTVEINCHGGIYVTKKVLEEVLSAGARLAEPGEFTKRAFLNGRIDLAEAEAVADVINSKTKQSLKASVAQLGGSISGRVKLMRDGILDHVAFMEAAMDDPEHISMEGHLPVIKKDVEEYLSGIKALLESFNEGRILKEGIQTVILGKTNAGKSSLLNLLTGSDTAIVTDIEGTTRDTVKEQVTLGGIILNLTDTAGIRETKDRVEAIGVEKALAHADMADLILLVIDAGKPLDRESDDIFEAAAGKNCIVLLNKSDISENVTPKDVYEVFERQASYEKDKFLPVIRFSAKTGDGLKELEGCIKKMYDLGNILENDEPVIINSRHRECLLQAEKSLEMVQGSLDMEMSEDLLTVDMMDAYIALGKILGEEIEDDLADRIFEKFCMGK